MPVFTQSGNNENAVRILNVFAVPSIAIARSVDSAEDLFLPSLQYGYDIIISIFSQFVVGVLVAIAANRIPMLLALRYPLAMRPVKFFRIQHLAFQRPTIFDISLSF